MSPNDHARGSTLLVSLAALLGAVAAGVACGTRHDPAAGSPDASIADAAPLGADRYGASPCGLCVEDVCRGALRGCGAEPRCAAHLACLARCPTGPRGDVLPACEAACGAPEGSAARTALGAVQACRRGDAVTRCAACGGSRNTSALLNQTCDDAPKPTPLPSCPENDTPVVRACRACSFARCCDSRRACNEDPACRALTECIGACDAEDAGLGGCLRAFEAGVPKFSPVVACNAVRCDDECNERPRDVCDRCLVDACGDDLAAGLATPEGYLHQVCRSDCSRDGPCLEACDARYPGAAKESVKVLACAVQRCSAECGFLDPGG